MLQYNQKKTKLLQNLKLNEKMHRYSSGGIAVASVTQVIEPLTPFATMPDRILADARERGHAVHKLTEIFDKIGDIPEEFPYRGLEGYLEGWKRFLEETKFNVCNIEEKVYHTQYNYVGTFDRVGILEGRLVVLDIKTGMLYPEYALQTAAYKEAINEGLIGDKVEGRFSVQLIRGSEEYKLTEYKNKTDFSVFLSALNLYNWKGNN